MRHKIVIFCFLLFKLHALQAGRLEKAFAAFERHDYFKAKALFEKSFKKDKTAASYGLSKIYGTRLNPYYQLDSAYNYIRISEESFHLTSEKEKVQFLKFSLDSIGIQIWKDSLDYKAYQRVSKIESVKAYQQYIDQYTDAIYRNDAIEQRNQLAFDQSRKINSSQAYQSFLEKYPSAKQRFEAANRFEERLFQEKTEKGDILSYKNFVANYPQSTFNEKAQDSVFIKSTKGQKVEDYYRFIKGSPKNKNVNKAWRSLYRLYSADYSPQRIIEFKIDYPDYPFVEELMIDMHLASKQFLPYRKNKHWGFMDKEGGIQIEAKYDFVEEFFEGLAMVGENGKVGFINKNGKTIIPFKYDDASSFREGVAIVTQNEKYGLIDRLGKELIGLKYDFIGPFKNELAVVANDTAYGYIDRTAAVRIPLTLEYASDYSNGYAVVQLNNMKGAIDKSGKLVIPCQYQWLEPFNASGICRAKNDSLFGILDYNGAEVQPFVYDLIDELNRELNIVAKENYYGYINKTGVLTIPITFNFVRSQYLKCRFQDQFARYNSENRFGIIDSSGEKIFPAIFEDIGQYSDSNWVAVKKRGLWGYSNQNLRLMIPYQYNMAFTFNQGHAIVMKDSLFGFIDADENYTIPPIYEKVTRLEDIGYLVYKEEKLGLNSFQLEKLLPTIYDHIEVYNEELLRIEENSEVYYFNLQTSKIIRSH